MVRSKKVLNARSRAMRKEVGIEEDEADTETQKCSFHFQYK